MNLVEALKIDRPIRRPIASHKGSNNDGWISPEFYIMMLCEYRGEGLHLIYPPRPSFWPTPEDILADDWEVMENQ